MPRTPFAVEKSGSCARAGGRIAKSSVLWYHLVYSVIFPDKKERKMMKMQDDLISVIVPVYGTEKYLDRCIESIVNQTYKNTEILLVDDGSPDESGKICDAWGKRDRRIRVIHKRNGGLSSARNAGLDAAAGVYLAFADSDDYLREDMLERLHALLTENGTPLAMCGFIRTDECGKPVDAASSSGEHSSRIIAQREMMGMFADGRYTLAAVTWNKLYRRELFQGIRFPEGKICEDGYIMHEIFGKCSQCAFTPEKMYFYIRHSDSILGAGLTIQNLTHIEACCRRIDYLKQNGFEDLCPKAVYHMFRQYLMLTREIPVKSRSDLKRYREIRKMVRACCKEFGQEIPPMKRALSACPVPLIRIIRRMQRVGRAK